jgi:hypothetical protein
VVGVGAEPVEERGARAGGVPGARPGQPASAIDEVGQPEPPAVDGGDRRLRRPGCAVGAVAVVEVGQVPAQRGQRGRQRRQVRIVTTRRSRPARLVTSPQVGPQQRGSGTSRRGV